MDTVFWILWSLSVEWKEARGTEERDVTCISAETLWYDSLKRDYQKLPFDIQIISVQHETTWFLIFSDGKHFILFRTGV